MDFKDKSALSEREKVARILAISCTALGDTLLSTPALRALRESYPEAHITLIIHPSLCGLFANLPSVDEIVSYDGKWRGFWRTARLLRQYDLAVILHGNEPQATPLAYLSGARFIFKLPNNNRWNFLLSNAQPILCWEDLGHGIEQRLAVAELAGAKLNAGARMEVPEHPEGRKQLIRALETLGWAGQPLIVLQPGASTTSRRWPRRHFISLALALAEQHPDLRFVVTGSPAEKLLCQEIVQGINLVHAAFPLAWSSADQLPLTALPDLFRQATVMVTGDTGPMHLAVTVNTPVVALFAVSDPRRSGPAYDLERHIVIKKWRTCDPCLSKRCSYREPICMDNISVDEVRQAVIQILERP